MRLLTIVAAVAFLAPAGAMCQDNYIDLPVKWSQPDWNSYLWWSDCSWGPEHSILLADDFLCEDPDPIVAVRWWGIYAGVGNPDLPEWEGPWHISFHYAVDPHPFSVPGDLIVLYDLDVAHQFCVGYIGAEAVYQHEAYLPWPFDQWTYSQESPNYGELFMDICKPTPEGEEPDFWHWCTVPEPNPRGPDFGAWSRDHNGPWFSLGEDGFYTDFAFELMVPEPCTLATFALALSSIGLALRLTRRP